MIKTLQAAQKQEKLKMKLPKSVQQAIPIQRLWQDGTFQFGSKFSQTVRFSDINYAIASKADKTQMFLGYSELLNALDTGAATKITIHNRRMNRQDFARTTLLPMHQDHLDSYRREYNQILSNEKYIGNALFQKTYTLDFISKKVCKNNGDLPMVLIEHHHPAIISHGLFQQVQSERTRRSLQKRKRSRKTKIATRKFSGKYALSDRLICGECGSIYRHCVWNVSGVRRTVWRCCSRLEFGKAYCHRSPTIEEAALHRSIVSAINQYIEKQRKSPAKTPPPKPLITDAMNYSRHISEMQSDAQQFQFNEIKSWLSAHRDGIQCYDDQAVRLLVQKITVVSKDMISVKFYGRRGKIVVIL